jgi:ligand-binding sensor domain-containing protein/two-component sensor histidine kinase
MPGLAFQRARIYCIEDNRGLRCAHKQGDSCARQPTKPSNAIRISLLFTLLFATASSVQADRLPIKTYTAGDGLASDSVNRIVRDSRGFLWFCTSEGLSRFDGYKFTNYGVDQGLPDRQVNDLLETRGGVYWVATSGGLCRFNPNPAGLSADKRASYLEPKFITFRLGENSATDHERYKRSDAVYKLSEDPSGAIWCGAETCLYRIDFIDGQWRATAVDLGPPTRLGSVNAFSILADHAGAVWVLTGSGLYRRRSDGVVERYGSIEGLSLTDFSSLYETRDRQIWVGTGVALYRLVAEPVPGHNVVAQTYTMKDGLANKGVSCIFQTSDGKLWVGSWTGLNEALPSVDKEGRQFRGYSISNGITNVGSLGEDRDGNLWIGTETNGAMKIAANGFVSYSEADGLGATRVGGIMQLRTGELCVISAGRGQGFLNRFDGRRFIPIPLSLPRGVTKASWGWYQNMFVDRTGEWWLSTFQGLARYPKLNGLEQLSRVQPKALYTTRDGLSGNSLFRIFEDSRGDIWSGTIDIAQSSLSRWQRSTGTFQRFTKEDGIPEGSPTAFCEDGSGSLWIGFYNGGVARYRDGHFEFFSTVEGAPAGFVRALYLDHSGRLWISSGEGGVARIDDPTAKRPNFLVYTVNQGLSSNHTTCLTEDRWGRIYIGTGRGVDQLIPDTGQVKHFTTADGLANNSVNVSFRDASGDLWFGTLDGLSRLVPRLDQIEAAPQVLISGLRIAGEQRGVSELGETRVAGLTLEANQNQVQIDFLGLGFASGETLRYQYKLDGGDKEWTPLSDQRSVTYANLSAGSYCFYVRAIGSAGLESSSPATISFTILPPVWRRWWFVILTTLVVLAIAYALYRYRVTHLIELERVRTRIATDLHDDIGSSLSQVSVLSEVIQRRVKHESGVTEPLSMIASLSRDLVDSMNDIVWAINPKRDHLSDLSQRMRRFASDLFTARNIDFTFKCPDADHDIRLGADMRREVFLIFKESVTNLVRHSGCTQAEIEFLIEDGWLELRVRDNGKGLNFNDAGDGNGLISMRQRAIRLGGQLEIIANGNRGTMVKLRARLRRLSWISS